MMELKLAVNQNASPQTGEAQTASNMAKMSPSRTCLELRQNGMLWK